LDTTYQDYVRTARVIRALELLTDDDKPITQIALEVEDSSLSAFHKTFKLLTVLSPSEYQQLLGNQRH